MAFRWDPVRYSQYAGERSRPFFDLVNRIEADAPATVVDLGCGSGELTATLARRWPGAAVRGLDASPEMIGQARQLAGPLGESAGPRFDVAAAEDFSAGGVDVLISNAVLQWVPGHQDLISRWAKELNVGGWIAFQVPANFDEPSHRLMRELAAELRWRERLSGVLRHHDAVSAPAEYLDLLERSGLRADVWQTSYLHVLQGPDPVLDWVRGTGLRPVLAALPDEEAEAFVAEYRELLRGAYPELSYGTVLPYLRLFAVGRKAS